jgi:hypothetical protein
MKTEIKIAPKNSLLLVMDKDSGEVPESLEGNLVFATASCIAVGTLSEVDGETSVLLTDEAIQSPQIQGSRRVFSGILATPKKVIDVCTVLLEPVMTLPVQGEETNVEIWANHTTEPNKLCIVTS